MGVLSAPPPPIEETPVRGSSVPSPAGLWGLSEQLLSASSSEPACPQCQPSVFLLSASLHTHKHTHVRTHPCSHSHMLTLSKCHCHPHSPLFLSLSWPKPFLPKALCPGLKGSHQQLDVAPTPHWRAAEDQGWSRKLSWVLSLCPQEGKTRLILEYPLGIPVSVAPFSPPTPSFCQLCFGRPLPGS